MDKWYSNLLHRSAEKWGVPVMPGRPLIGDDSAAYPSLTVVEDLQCGGDYNYHGIRFQLVTLNDQWSFAASFTVKGSGCGFGPFLKFCDPVPTRKDALIAAIEWAEERGAAKDKSIREWLDALKKKEIEPQQLTLF